jgi:DNA gyrase/topoisomerase IV subunit A
MLSEGTRACSERNRASRSFNAMRFLVNAWVNQQAVFIDSNGRSYSLQAHTLPSARSQGEPLTGRLSPSTGATFQAVLGGDTQSRYLLASDAGYGFVTRLDDMFAKNKSGKALLNLPKGGRVLPPVPVIDVASDRVAAITNEGRMLVFPLAELPEMARGKGNKIIAIPAKRIADREEYVVALAVVPQGQSLTAHAGKRYIVRFCTTRAHLAAILSAYQYRNYIAAQHVRYRPDFPKRDGWQGPLT